MLLRMTRALPDPALSLPAHWSPPRAQPSRRSMVDDGSGKVEVWRIEDFADVVVPLNMHGQFFAGDSYIVQYTYFEGNKESYILYFWLGSKSSQDEKGAAALLTKTKDDALGGAATQVRVVQGQEPSHFVRLFKGHMVVHAGGKASGFSGSDGDYYDTDGVSLFHVKGSDEFSTSAAQAPSPSPPGSRLRPRPHLAPGPVALTLPPPPSPSPFPPTTDHCPRPSSSPPPHRPLTFIRRWTRRPRSSTRATASCYSRRAASSSGRASSPRRARSKCRARSPAR